MTAVCSTVPGSLKCCSVAQDMQGQSAVADSWALGTVCRERQPQRRCWWLSHAAAFRPRPSQALLWSTCDCGFPAGLRPVCLQKHIFKFQRQNLRKCFSSVPDLVLWEADEWQG